MSVVQISSESHFQSLTGNANPTQLIALYFHTPWAAPCQQMSSVFDALAQANPQAQFLSINADDHADIAELFDVSAVPYFVFVRDGTIIKELSGADPKELASAISEANQNGQSIDNNNSNSTTTNTPPNNSNAVVKDILSTQETPDDLNTRLGKLVSAAPIMLFMKGTPASPKCGFSRQLVAILREHKVKFGFFDILKDDEVRQGLKTYSDWPTFPQLYIGGELQGGLDIVKEGLEDDPNFFENALQAIEA